MAVDPVLVGVVLQASLPADMFQIARRVAQKVDFMRPKHLPTNLRWSLEFSQVVSQSGIVVEELFLNRSC